MKRLIMLAAMAATAVLLPGKAAATANPFLLNLNVSGTVEVWTNVNEWDTNNAGASNRTEVGVASSVTMSFNNKYIYNLISNAVANAYGDLGTNLTPTILPAKGYIAFNVISNDNPYDEGSGTFYVTTRTGSFFPLSGYDSKTNYYSFIELDDDDFDFYENFYGADVGGINDRTLKGTFTENEPSVFYVHDNPYSYDAGDNPSVVINNFMAIEIRSNIKAIWGYTNWNDSPPPAGPEGDVVKQTDVSTGGGCGNAVIKGQAYSAVTTGKISLLP
jgi:hypothetical protein